MQVAVEARLVDRGEGTESHRDRREFPELGHEPRVRIARESLAPNDLPPEVIELRLGEPALDERARVDARRAVPLEADLMAGRAVVLPTEEVVEPDLGEARAPPARGEATA